MSAPVEPPVAWEPLTPHGVAAFARAPLSRLLLVQFVIAALAATAVIWLLYDGCFPTVRAAIRNLPAAGAIRSGRLDWPGDAPQLLAEGRLLAFTVDAGHSDQVRSPADVEIEFGRQSIRVFSGFGFGYAEWNYPAEWTVAFNRTDLEPLWGAWEPEWLAITLLTGVAGLMLLWALLATVYFLPVRLIGFLANRALDYRGSWKLSGAALLPGALLLTVGIMLYDFGALNLIQFGFLFAVHVVAGWIYLLVGPLFLPRAEPAAPGGNPFSSAQARPAANRPSAKDNPFVSGQ
jgi:hypothetical protein